MGRKDYRPPARYALGFEEQDARVEIDAFDSGEAFARAQKLVSAEGAAVLYEDGVPLARIGYSPSGFWTVSQAA